MVTPNISSSFTGQSVPNQIFLQQSPVGSSAVAGSIINMFNGLNNSSSSPVSTGFAFAMPGIESPTLAAMFGNAAFPSASPGLGLSSVINPNTAFGISNAPITGFSQATGLPPATGFAQAPGAQASPVNPAIQLQNAIIYGQAVDNEGNVNIPIITQNGAITMNNAISNVLANYWSEFRIGNRTRDPGQYAASFDQLVSDLQGNNGQGSHDSAFFLAVATSYRNQGPAYNNQELANLLNQSGNSDLITQGVGNDDLSTIGAVGKAIQRGTLSPSQIYNTTTGLDALGNLAVPDKGAYDKAIAYVNSGQFLSDVLAVESGGQASPGPSVVVPSSNFAVNSPFASPGGPTADNSIPTAAPASAVPATSALPPSSVSASFPAGSSVPTASFTTGQPAPAGLSSFFTVNPSAPTGLSPSFLTNQPDPSGLSSFFTVNPSALTGLSPSFVPGQSAPAGFSAPSPSNAISQGNTMAFAPPIPANSPLASALASGLGGLGSQQSQLFVQQLAATNPALYNLAFGPMPQIPTNPAEIQTDVGQLAALLANMDPSSPQAAALQERITALLDVQAANNNATALVGNAPADIAMNSRPAASPASTPISPQITLEDKAANPQQILQSLTGLVSSFGSAG